MPSTFSVPAKIPVLRHGRGAQPTVRRKVVLYNPRSVFFTMPLGVLSVASNLDSARYEPVIVDGRLEADPVAAVLRQLDGALCLGVSVLTGAPIRDAIAVSRAAKTHFPDLPVVWGGWHPSLFPTECLEEPSVDITVQAQGEETFAEILDRLTQGRSLEGCLGCSYRNASGCVRQNAPRPLRDVNAFPAHDFDLLPVERYYALKGKRQLDFISSQGCNFRCAFCADPQVYGRQWVGLEPVRLAGEIDRLWQRYHFDDLNFQDETFFTRSARVESIADELLRRRLPITWAATMRADQGERLADSVWRKCKESGLRRVLIGVESGSQDMLDRIRKDIRLEQVHYCARQCLRHDIAIIFPFIVGFPGETDTSVWQSLDLAKQLRTLSSKFETPIFYFRPYPGSAITAEAVANGYRLPRGLEEWADFDYVDSRGPWVSQEKYRLVERFKFYSELAFKSAPRWQWPLQAFARIRCRRDWYTVPIEKGVMQTLAPPTRLS